MPNVYLLTWMRRAINRWRMCRYWYLDPPVRCRHGRSSLFCWTTLLDDSGLFLFLNHVVSFACYVSEESTASIFRVTYLATTQFKNQKTTIT